MKKSKIFLKELIIKSLEYLKFRSSARKIIVRFTQYTPKAIKNRRKYISFFSQFIKKGDLCFDIGANVGTYTKFFLKLGAKVVCVEPQQDCIKRLKDYFGKNKNVVILEKALGDHKGSGKLAICDDMDTISTLSKKWREESRWSKLFKWTRTQNISITTLDNLIQLYGLPIFCKIDVEGFELEVLKGLSKRIKYISFEFTKEFFDDAIKCVNYLLSIGNVKFNCSIGGSFNLLFSKWVTPKTLYRRLESTKDKFLWGDIYAKFIF